MVKVTKIAQNDIKFSLHILQESDAKSITSSNLHLTYILIFESIFIVVFNGLVGYYATFSDDTNAPMWLQIFLVFVWTITFFFGFLSPSVIANYLTRQQHLGFVNRHLEILDESIRERLGQEKDEQYGNHNGKVNPLPSPKKGEMLQSASLDNYIQRAFEAQSLIKALNRAYGPNILVESGVDLLCESVGLFLSSTFFLLSTGVEFNIMKLFFR